MEEKPRTTDSVLIEGIRALYEKSKLCDLTFLAGGERFPAHGAIVAAMSSNFGKYLLGLSPNSQEASEDPMQGLLSVASAVAPGVAPGADGAEPAAPAAPAAAPAEQPGAVQAPPAAPSGGDGAGGASAAAAPSGQGGGKGWPRNVELQVSGIDSPEAMRLMLSYVYTANGGAPWEYEPSSSEVNKDVLRLARHFGLSHLHEHAARWLTKGLNTANVVDRLVTCEEFGLNRLRERMIEQLTAHPAELAVVSSSAEIMRHPRILQDLLVQVASLCGVGGEKAEKADKTQKKGGQGQVAEKPEKVEKAERAEKPEKAAAPEKPSMEKPPAKRAKRGAAGS